MVTKMTQVIDLTEDTELLQATKKGTKTFSFDGLTVKAKCVDVYDGDTATFAFRLCDGAPVLKHRCRMLHYNCAEMKSTDPAELAAAIRARDALTGLILGKVVELKLFKSDKWGRPLVEVCTIDCQNVNRWMIEQRYGLPYSGKGAKSWC